MSEVEQVLTEKMDSKLKKMKQVDLVDQEATDQLQNLYCALRQKLDPQLAAIKIQQKELEQVEAQLLAALDEEHDAAHEGVRKTESFLLSFGPKGKSTSITNKKRLIEILGIDTYLEIADISITDLRKYLSPDQLLEVAKEERKTKRRLTFAAAGG